MPRVSSRTAAHLCSIAARFLSRCREWLGTPRCSKEEVPATDYQIWVAQEFGKLLAIALDSKPVGKENIRKVLVHYVDSFSEGNRIAAAEIAGCRRGSFHNCCNGATTGRTGPLLRMCYELKIPLTSLFTGATAGLEDTAGVKAAVEARISAALRLSQRGGFVRHSCWRPRKNRLPASRSRGENWVSTPTRLYAADSDLSKAIVRNFNKSGRNHW